MLQRDKEEMEERKKKRKETDEKVWKVKKDGKRKRERRITDFRGSGRGREEGKGGKEEEEVRH